MSRLAGPSAPPAAVDLALGDVRVRIAMLALEPETPAELIVILREATLERAVAWISEKGGAERFAAAVRSLRLAADAHARELAATTEATAT